MRSKPTAITELPPSLEDEQRSRMIRYGIAMGIRVACVGLLFVFQGWWLLIPAIGAIVIPYFAVVVANNVSQRGAQTVARPGGLLPVRPAGPSVPPGAAPRNPDPHEDAA
ncbi:hypothetical protein BH11ACT3_BH11ACT3_07880 [soil metagenome]